MDYLKQYGRENAVAGYLDLIRDAKAAVSIPVIASVHCTSPGVWMEFARKAEQAGADALELNVFVLPSNPHLNGLQNEQVYFELAAAVKRMVSIPVALKVGYFFSSVIGSLGKLGNTGIDGLVLFNRSYRPDFDIETLALTPASFLSTPEESTFVLRWTAILSDRVSCDIAANTGIHDGAAVIKQLLAGAAAVQVCSILYRNGVGHLETMLHELEAWMVHHRYESIEQFKGKLSQGASPNPAAYERVQFMRGTRSWS
jgi:dihydroorotate dehydrogenase (fumarate)